MTVTELAANETLPVATLDDILSADDVKHADVEVPEWNARVAVRGLSRKQVLAWSDTGDDMSEADAILLHHGLVDPEVTLEQAREIVASKSHSALLRVLREVMRLSGIGIGFQGQGTNG